jgi:hypothetical protein
MTPDINEVKNAIAQGEYDTELSNIESYVRQRRRSKTKTDFAIGTRVVFNDQVSPKYMAGVKGVVHGFKNTRVLVTVDDNQYLGRFDRGGTGRNAPITCPPSILDPVEA